MAADKGCGEALNPARTQGRRPICEALRLIGIIRFKVGAAQLLQAQPGQRVPEGAAAAQGAQDRRDLDQEELPDQRGAEDLSEVV